MILALFEDAGYLDFAPISLSTPLFLLKPGPHYVYEMWSGALAPDSVALFIRSPLDGYWRWRLTVLEGKEVMINPGELDEEVLALNARVPPLPGNLETIARAARSGTSVLLHSQGVPLAVKVSRGYSAVLAEILSRPPEPELFFNLAEIVKDIPFRGSLIGGFGELGKVVHELLRAQLEPTGGMVVSKGAEVEGNVRLRPPVYIGEGVKVVEGSEVSHSAVHGPSVVEGTVRCSLIEQYSELRHSYVEGTLGMGCNLLTPYSSAWGEGARVMGFFARVFSSQLIGQVSAGVGAKVYVNVDYHVGSLRAATREGIVELPKEEVVRELRVYLARFNRLPSDHEVRLIEEAAHS